LSRCKIAGPLVVHTAKISKPPGRPGIFALGVDGALERLFSDARFSNVETRIIRAPLKLATAKDALEMIQQTFGAYRAVIADLKGDEQAAAWPEVLAALKQFESAEGFQTEFEFIIGAGSST